MTKDEALDLSNQEPVDSEVKGAIMCAAYDFRDAHISGSMNLKRSAHAVLENAVDAALKATQPAAQPALKDHETAQLVNRLTTIAKEFGQTQQLRERIAHELRATPPAAPVPEGWKLVPVEPTGDMLAALAQEWHSSRYEAFRGRYALMLSAAPEKGGAA